MYICKKCGIFSHANSAVNEYAWPAVTNSKTHSRFRLRRFRSDIVPKLELFMGTLAPLLLMLTWKFLAVTSFNFHDATVRLNACKKSKRVPTNICGLLSKAKLLVGTSEACQKYVTGHSSDGYSCFCFDNEINEQWTKQRNKCSSPSVSESKLSCQTMTKNWWIV